MSPPPLCLGLPAATKIPPLLPPQPLTPPPHTAATAATTATPPQVQFHGFSLPLVRKFSEQLLRSLAFLARPDVRVIHTDIKPENICIRNPRRSAIKLIDFGSSCQEGQQMFTYIQSRCAPPPPLKPPNAAFAR